MNKVINISEAKTHTSHVSTHNKLIELMQEVHATLEYYVQTPHEKRVSQKVEDLIKQLIKSRDRR